MKNAPAVLLFAREVGEFANSLTRQFTSSPPSQPACLASERQPSLLMIRCFMEYGGIVCKNCFYETELTSIGP